NALERKRLQDENQALKRQLRRERGFENSIGKSRQMLDIFDTIRKAAEGFSTVLVTGESGTGKELVARAIHDESPRRNGPFVSVNCGAIPETLMESELFGHAKGAFTGAVADTVGLFSAAAAGTPLVAHSLTTASATLGRPVSGVTPEALTLPEHYHWPGNVRELENVIERALVLGSGDTLDASALPSDLGLPRNVQAKPVEIPEEG